MKEYLNQSKYLSIIGTKVVRARPLERYRNDKGNDKLGVYKIYMVRMSNATDELSNVSFLTVDVMKTTALLRK